MESSSPPDRHATIRDVADAAGVSPGLVSQYLNGRKRVAPETEARITDAVRRLRYVPNAGVRIMQGQRNRLLAFFVPDMLNPFIADVARGIEDVALGQGHVVVTCNTDGDPSREAAFAQVLAGMRITGAIAMSMSDPEEPLDVIAESGAAVVLLGSPSEKFRSVLGHNSTGGRLAMEHLLERGHDRFVFFGGPGAARPIEDRFGAAARALSRNAPAATWVRRDAPGNDNASRIATAHSILDEFGGQRIAVFCANDLLALALESAAIRRGIAIPDQLAIVGYDDIEGAENAVIPLTTISQPGYAYGQIAAHVALGHELDDVRGPDPILIARRST